MAYHRPAMDLHYLDFELSDTDDGSGSFDALAAVPPSRLPALLAEVSAVLQWAARHHGPAGPLDEGAVWDFELQAHTEPGGAPLALQRAPGDGAWQAAGDDAGRVAAAARVSLALTLGGTAGFCDDFQQAFRPGE